MFNTSYQNIAVYYFVEDLPSASLPGTRLQAILELLQAGKPITLRAAAFLKENGFNALHRLAEGDITYAEFSNLAIAEKAERIEAAAEAKIAREVEEKARKAELMAKAKLVMEQREAARIARESDPKYIAKVKNKELRQRYGIDSFVENIHFSRLMRILKSVDANKRLSHEDFLWLSTVGEEYFSNELRVAYHQREADFFVSEFKKSGNPWKAVNASGHFRKCRRPKDAESLLATINVEKQKSSKLKSALHTTHGGVMRDLGQHEKAMRFGLDAHALMPEDYRPCTLLGAVHNELGNYSTGQEWYDKAIKRGASIDSVDQDLRSIFYQSDHAKRAEMGEFLLRLDPIRFAWVKKRGKANKSPSLA